MRIGDDLDQIRKRGALRVAVSLGIPGLSEPTPEGWSGLDADFARAVAAAILGDDAAVEWTPVAPGDRIPVVVSGEADLGACNLSWTMARSAQVSFVGVLCHDGEGLLVRSTVPSASALDGRRVSVQAGTTTAQNLQSWADRGGPRVEPVAGATPDDALRNYLDGTCEAYVLDRTALAGIRSRLPDPDAHALLPDVISSEPMAPYVAPDSVSLLRASQAVLWALIAADDHADVADRIAADDQLGPSLGLPAGWAHAALAVAGSYRDLFDRNLGPRSPLGLEPGPHRTVTTGGAMFAPAI